MTAKPEKVAVTPELRRLWLRIRNAWAASYGQFTYSLSSLDDKQAGLMYDLVKHSLYRNFFPEILRDHPELREFLKTDDDRLCMHDIYEVVSWRLGRSEPPPPDKELAERMKGGIGRKAPDLDYP